MAASDQFYLDIVEEVDAVIDEFGKSFTVRSPGAYDPETLTSAPGAERDIDGVIANQQDVNNLGSQISAVAETSQTWIAKKSLIFKASSNIAVGEEVYVDGSWFPLANATPIKPADVVVVYMLDVSL